ncbi:hypothetical protein ABB37_07492 [Leptomonas pyrrhocoris]|uniref:AAA+ ATPase domain-containing protein n=1 Tax=Leptomonas pyrrhocoris TaxID=157538 RepID=A0A0N0DSY5_LEPPY|nr:hypothetical protein ABB37_07492 [Leptomonas pyrrhocoris]KPA76634.1 hypothetical protein ABB37_07492 [Leptomonas pyrrhocoris]|eukprot:XP_015655073.1 hypothetical protein ABB37_07492 [Leptomonas pyrrhocoris]
MDSYADLLNLNFMYSLRTGNLLTDMMIAALLPLVSGAVAYVTRTWWPQLVNRLLAYFSNIDSTSVSFRTSEEHASIYYGFTLRLALSTYVTKVLRPRFDVAELKYLSIPGKRMHEAASYAEALRDFCFVDAGPAKEVPMKLMHNLELRQSDAGGGDEGDKKDKGEASGGSKKTKVSRDTLFTLIQYRPSFPTMRKLMWAEEARADRGASAQELAELEEKTKGNGDAIQLVLDRALEHYREEYKQAGISTDRYLYQPLLMRPKLGFGVSGADEKAGNEGKMDCNRYLLRSEKTFSSLFFPEKPRLLQLIEDFENKTGKYAIPGYPQKLVLLLYGPPGTGKTSLAKAVAAHTQRDLFAISLSRIWSDEELLKYMFSGHVKVKNEEDESNNNRYGRSDNEDRKALDPTKLVYILEDVDATSAVVLKGEEEQEEDAAQSAAVAAAGTEETERSSSVPGSLDMSEASKRKRKKKAKGSTRPLSDDGGGSERDGAEGAGDEDAADASRAVSVTGKETAESTKADAESISTEREVVAVKGKNARRTSKLTIKGLTNALNGVLDFPQRIVIMTTNHIEKLHPSLLRPGVVTMKLHMHNFDADCALAMVAHYFSHTVIRPEQLEELRTLVEAASPKASKADTTASVSEDAAVASGAGNSTSETKRFSPAELEQRCAECETIDELLAALRQGSRVNTF